MSRMVVNMSPAKAFSREELLRILRKFARDFGRPPKTDEPGFDKIVRAAKTEFASWEHALRIAGLQTYKAWRRRRTLGSEVRRLLNYNPMTLTELRQELAKSPIFASKPQSIISPSIVGSVKQDSGVKSIGPRGTKIYFLQGQDALAQTRLEAIMSEIPPLEEEIFCRLRQPMTRSQIEKLIFGDQTRSHDIVKLCTYLKELELARLIYRVRFVGGKGHGHARRFTSYELFGELAGKTLYCRFDCPNEVAQLITENIPSMEFYDRDSKIKISGRRDYLLRRMLPENAYRTIESKL